MRKRVAVIVVSVLVAASFAVGLLTPAQASPSVRPLKANSANSLVCVWMPILNLGLC